MIFYFLFSSTYLICPQQNKRRFFKIGQDLHANRWGVDLPVRPEDRGASGPARPSPPLLHLFDGRWSGGGRRPGRARGHDATTAEISNLGALVMALSPKRDFPLDFLSKRGHNSKPPCAEMGCLECPEQRGYIGIVVCLFVRGGVWQERVFREQRCKEVRIWT